MNIGLKYNCDKLDSVRLGCDEILEELERDLETTTNQLYHDEINKDIVIVRNLRFIMLAVKEDIMNGWVGASTELLLRIAANDLKNKLTQIPEKKKLCKEIAQLIKNIHKDIFNSRIKS